jgi:DNA-binding SARP family transcriptional activator/ketosteroid isomerase-like protein
VLELRLCGGIEVAVDGELLPESAVGGRQVRLVLAYLVCERDRAVRREELAELLWPEQVPDSWTVSLSAVISRLRRLFTDAGFDGPSVVASTGGAYQLHLPEDTSVDVEDLAAAVDEAEDAAAHGDTAAAVHAATRAETVAARGFLTDECEWVDRRRAAIRDLRARAAIAQSTAHLRAGSAARAIDAARRAVDIDPSREAAHRELMVALAAAGERAEALRVWERCRITLVEELGVDPSPATEAVYLSLLDVGGPPPASEQTTVLPSGVVTFLLTDIVESSALWEEHPNAMAAALERHDELIGSVVAASGGTLLKSKLEGDATVSVFARATQGAAAALALFDAMESEPWSEGVLPRLRMALHTGEAFERGGDYFGPALNRAARLRALASANEVLLSQAVAELVRDHLPAGVVLRERGMQNLRGLSRGENVFELVRAGSTTGAAVFPVETPDDFERPPVPAALPASGPFVGRSGEVEQLDDMWQRAVAGEATALFIGGEPGVGKSRLASELAQRAYASGGLVLYGRCDDDLAAPLQPFIEAVRVLAPALGPTRLRAVRGVDELTRVVPELSELLGAQPAARADPDTERLALFDAVTRLLAATSVDVPVLLVLDDLHWAGRTTLSMLRHVLRGVKGSRILVVGTYRDTELARTHPLAETLADLRRDNGTHRISLSGLEPDDVAAYLGAIGNDDRALARELAEVTAGNPFFLIEVVRHVEESGGSWQPGSLPEGVREATGRRLSRLSDAANEALSVAAVVGATFDLALVEQIRGTDLIDPIAEAVRAGLVIEEPGSFARFRFAHAIVRQVLLSELVSMKRVRLHRTIAELLEDAPGTDPDARLADLAYHWSECASAGSGERAVDACRRAADRAVERLAYEEAGDLYGMALQAVEWVDGADAEIEAALHLARCDALLTAGDVAGAREALDALELAAAGSERLAAWYTTYEGLLAVLGEPDRLHEIVQSIGAAAGAMRDVGDVTGEAKARYVHASALERLGQIGAAERALDAALAAARNAGDRRLADAILAEAPQAALWGPSPVTRASGRCLDVVRVLRITSGTPAVEAVALRCQAVLEALRGRMDAARRMIASSRRTVEQLGLTHRRLEADLMAGLIELLDGQPTEAEEHLRAAYEGLRERGLGGEAALAGAFLGRALLLQNRVDDADAVAAEAEALAGSDLKAAITWRDVRAEAAARRGHIDRALALARESVELATSTDALLLSADARLTLASVLRAAGDAPAADAEARRAVEACDAKGATVMADLARAAMGVTPAVVSLDMSSKPMVAQGTRAIPNLATASAIRMREAFNRGDWDAMRANRTPEQKYVDHRPVIGLTLYGDDMHAQFARAGNALFDAPELLATRGDRIELSRWNLRSPDFEAPFLGVTRVDTDGLLDEFVVFEPEAIDDAIATIDAMASADAFENDATRAYRQMCDAFNAHDWDALLAGIADDYHVEDRRSVVGSSLDHEQSVESLRVIFDGGGTFEWETVATRGRSLALTRTTLHVPGLEAGDTVLSLTIAHPQHPRRLAIVFDIDDLDGALAELDRLFVEGEGAEHAPRLACAASLFNGFATTDTAAVRALLAPGFRLRNHRNLALPELTADEWLASFGDLADLYPLGHSQERVDHISDLSEHGGLWLSSARGELAGGGTWEDRVLIAMQFAGGQISSIDFFAEHDVDTARAVLEGHRRSRAEPFENEATRYEDRIRAAYRVRDWKAALALYADDYVQEDRRSLVRVTLDREQGLAGVRLIFDGGGRFEVETVATRGRNLVLSRWLLSVPDPEAVAPVLTVNRVDDSGRAARTVLFDSDDLDSALAELDRQFLEGEAAEYAEVLTVVNTMLESVARQDLAAANECFSPDLVVRSHSFPGLQQVGVDGFRSSIAAGFEVFGAGSLRVEHVVNVADAGGIWGARLTGERDGGPYEYVFLLAIRVAGGRIVAIDHFDEHDLDAARAVLRDRPGRATAGFENDATRLSDRIHAAYRDHDWDALLGCMSDDFHQEDRRTVALVSSNYEDSLASVRMIFEARSQLESEIVATRGRSLILVATTIAVPEPEALDAALAICRMNDDGLQDLVVMFGANDLARAHAELDRLYCEDEAAEDADVVNLVSSFFGEDLRVSPAAARARLAPDFTFRSHRFTRGIQREQGADEFIDMVMRSLDVYGSGNTRIDHIQHLSRDGGLWFLTMADNDDRGGPFEISFLFVVGIADGCISSLDAFDEHDVDSARALLDERRRPSALWFENNATRATARVEAGYAARDLDAVEAVYSDDWFTDDRRAVVGSMFTVEQSRAQNRLIFQGGANLKRTVLATRGRSVSLERWDLWLAEHEAGEMVLTVTQVDEAGLYRLTVMFDGNDRESAYAELDRLYLEGEGAEHADVLTAATRFFDALVSHDISAVEAMLADNFVLRSYRTVRPADEQSAAEFLHDVQVGFGGQMGPGPYRIDHITRLSGDGGLWVVVFTGFDAEGGAYELPMPMVLRIVDGKIAVFEGYDETNVALAVEMLAERDSTHDLVAAWAENDAWRAARAWCDACNRRDRAAYLAVLDPAFVWIDYRQGVRLEQAQDTYLVMFDLDEFRMERELVGTRGERLALIRDRAWFADGAAGPSEIETLTVIETGSDGRIVSNIVFGPEETVSALDFLDDRYADEGYSGFATMRQSFDARDWERFRSVFAPDCTIVDRRTAGWGEVDRTAFVEYQRSIVELAPDANLWIDHTRCRGDVAMSTGRAFGTRDGAPWEIAFVTVGVGARTGVSRHFESYELGDFEAARHRFDELVAAHADAPVENAAWQAALRVANAANRHDWAALADEHDPNFVYDEHRHNAEMRLEGAEALATYRVMFALDDCRWDRTLLATRGDRLCLSRDVITFKSGMAGLAEVEVIALVECGADGRTLANIGFEASDIETAYAALEARHAELGEQVADTTMTRTLQRTCDAINRRDWDTFVAAHAPDFVFLDDRPGVRVHERGEHALDTYAIFLTFKEFTWQRTPIATRGDHLVLSRNRVEWLVGDAGPSEIESVSILECDSNGLIVRELGVDPEGLAAAYAALDARYAELLAEADGNVAWYAAISMWNALNRRDWHDFTATLAPHFMQVEDHHHLRLEGEDALATYRVLLTLDEYECRLSLVEARGENLALVRSQMTIRDRQAGPAEIDTFSLFEVDDDGLIIRIDALPILEDAARAALDARRAVLDGVAPDNLGVARTAQAELAARASELEPKPNLAARRAAIHQRGEPA